MAQIYHFGPSGLCNLLSPWYTTKLLRACVPKGQKHRHLKQKTRPLGFSPWSPSQDASSRAKAPFGEPDTELDAETLAQRALQQKRLPDFAPGPVGRQGSPVLGETQRKH